MKTVWLSSKALQIILLVLMQPLWFIFILKFFNGLVIIFNIQMVRLSINYDTVVLYN